MQTQLRLTGGRSVVAEVTTVTDTLDNTVPARYNTPNDVSGDGDWHRVVPRNGYVKPIRTQDYRMGVSEIDDFETYGTTQMVVADDPFARSNRMVTQLNYWQKGGYERLKTKDWCCSNTRFAH